MSESDQSDYYSDSDSESQISENVIKDSVEPEKNVIVSKNIKAFDDDVEAEDEVDDDDDDDEIEDETEDVDFLEPDDSQTGGAEDDSESDNDDKEENGGVVDAKATTKKIKRRIMLNQKTRRI